MKGILPLIIIFAVVFALICLCDAVHKAIQRKSDDRRNEADRARGAFRESAPESLADQFKVDKKDKQ